MRGPRPEDPASPWGPGQGYPSRPGPHTPVPTGWPYCVSAPLMPAAPKAGQCQVTLGPHEGPRSGCPGSRGKRRVCGPGQDSPVHHCGLRTTAPTRRPASAWVTGHFAPSVPQAGGVADSIFLLGLSSLSPGLSRLPRRPHPDPSGLLFRPRVVCPPRWPGDSVAPLSPRHDLGHWLSGLQWADPGDPFTPAQLPPLGQRTVLGAAVARTPFPF